MIWVRFPAGTNSILKMDLSDEQLMTKYLKGDEKSLEVLIKKYLKPIYNFTYWYVGHAVCAEDITQEVFIKMWRNLKKFNPQNKFKIWLFTIAKNTCLDYLKKKKSIAFSELVKEEDKNLLENIIDEGLLPDEIFTRKNLLEKINLAFEKLPIQSQIILFLHYNQEFSFQEISEILGEPLNTVKSRHYRAIVQLKKLLLNNEFSQK